MSGGIDVRLAREIRDWRNNHPHTDWEGGSFPLTLHFSEDYPRELPKCKFPPGFLHPNVYPSGTVCLSTCNEDSGPPPATILFPITVENILVGIQYLLDEPNPADPAQFFIQDAVEYKQRVRQQARQYPALV